MTIMFPETATAVRSYRLSAPNAADTAKLARDHVAYLLERGPLAPLVETARLLVSETVTNVHLHTGVARLVVETTLRADGVVVAVRDGAVGEAPCVREAFEDAEGGRGLRLVRALAANWGVTALGVGKSVWFELRADA